MQSRTTKLLVTTLAIGALAAPVAAASQDLRSPDARDAAAALQTSDDLRSPDARDAARPVAVVIPAAEPAQRAAPESPWFDAASAGVGAVALLLVGVAAAAATRTRVVRRHVAL